MAWPSDLRAQDLRLQRRIYTHELGLFPLGMPPTGQEEETRPNSGWLSPPSCFSPLETGGLAWALGPGAAGIRQPSLDKKLPENSSFRTNIYNLTSQLSVELLTRSPSHIARLPAGPHHLRLDRAEDLLSRSRSPTRRLEPLRRAAEHARDVAAD